MKFLIDLHPAIAVPLLCIITLFISFLGLKLVRKRFEQDTLKENHEVGGLIFNAFGLIYAVLVAFVVFATWTEYDDSKKNTDLEAIEISDLFRNSMALPDSAREVIKQSLTQYLDDVISDEWPVLDQGKASSKTAASFDRVWEIYTKTDVKNITNVYVYQESLKHLNDLGERRRTRLFDSTNNIPGIIWATLLFGGIMTIIYTYFFSTKKFMPQYMMTAALTILNTLILYMIYILDNPFAGYIKIDTKPYEVTLQLIKMGM
ncbi:MAG: DUF4239 domain-containing protein [Ignavibacteria bacterium]|nr:DUF4239 domain-containing protein [Ignavibacteria bacterium]MCC7158754.1 DUF4239 domain-containing protein [Ignavibacteria bacterium]